VLQDAWTAEADTDAMKANADPALDTDRIDEQRGCSAALWHCSVQQLVGVDEVVALNSGMAEFDHDKRIVGLPRLVDRERGIRRISGEIVLALGLRVAGLRAFRPPADATRPGRQNGSV